MFTSPVLPETFHKTQRDLEASSKPLKILSEYFSIDYMKENMPSQSAFLSIQMSEDRLFMYIAYVQISKERKFTYYVSRESLSPDSKDKISGMVTRLAATKVSMQKTPITIAEDLTALEKQSEIEI